MTIGLTLYETLTTGERRNRITLHQNNKFDANIAAIKLLIAGDVSVIPYIYEQYKYIADQTCRYIYYKMSTSIPYEDVHQQAHYEMYNALTNRVPNSDKDWLAEINENEGHEPCLGMRPYLISTIRGMLKLFVIERTAVIRPHKVIFEKEYIEKYGEPKPPKCISMIANSRNDEEFIIPGAIPIDEVQPIHNAIAEEIRARLNLTLFETRILKMRLDGKKLEDIAKETGKSLARVYRTIQSMQARYTRLKRNDG